MVLPKQLPQGGAQATQVSSPLPELPETDPLWEGKYPSEHSVQEFRPIHTAQPREHDKQMVPLRYVPEGQLVHCEEFEAEHLAQFELLSQSKQTWLICDVVVVLTRVYPKGQTTHVWLTEHVVLARHEIPDKL